MSKIGSNNKFCATLILVFGNTKWLEYLDHFFNHQFPTSRLDYKSEKSWFFQIFLSPLKATFAIKVFLVLFFHDNQTSHWITIMEVSPKNFLSSERSAMRRKLNSVPTLPYSRDENTKKRY